MLYYMDISKLQSLWWSAVCLLSLLQAYFPLISKQMLWSWQKSKYSWVNCRIQILNNSAFNQLIRKFTKYPKVRNFDLLKPRNLFRFQKYRPGSVPGTGKKNQQNIKYTRFPTPMRNLLYSGGKEGRGERNSKLKQMKTIQSMGIRLH